MPLTAPNVYDASLNYVYFIRALYKYKTNNKKIAKLCLSKCLNLLQYLNKECLVFSVFNKNIKLHIRKKLLVNVQNLKI